MLKRTPWTFSAIVKPSLGANSSVRTWSIKFFKCVMGAIIELENVMGFFQGRVMNPGDERADSAN